MSWTGHVAHMGKVTSAYNSSDGKCKGNRKLEKSINRWENNKITRQVRVWSVFKWFWASPTTRPDFVHNLVPV
jgi:hypothetical protein